MVAGDLQLEAQDPSKRKVMSNQLISSEHSQNDSKEEATKTPHAARPYGRAGIFDIDPPQTGVSQDPNLIVVGDVEALPEEV